MRNKLIIAAAFLSMGFASCLKNTDSLGFQNDKGSIVAEIATHNFEDPRIVSVEPLPATETLDFMTVAYHAARSNKPSGNIKLKFRLNASLIATYNSDNGTSFVQLPAGSYTFDAPNNEVEIPNGGSYGEKNVKITLNKNALSLTQTYALGVTVESVSEGVISEIAKNFLFIVGVKNKYDGVYELTMGSTGWGAFSIGDGVSDVYPAYIDLVTAGPDVVTIEAEAPSTFGNLQPGWGGGVGVITSATAFGATTPRYQFNTTTDKVISVVNTTPDDGRGRTLFLDPASTTSQWNPSTKDIYIEYFMTQNGRPNQRFTMAYHYIGPR